MPEEKANIGSKYTFPHVKLEDSDPYAAENQFISPKQINLFAVWANLSQMNS